MKFAADYTLGKLAKTLRILGFDTMSFRELNAEAVQVIAQEGRVLLTRNKKLVQTVPNSVFMDMNSPDDQLKSLIHFLNLKLDPDRFFSLCTFCNQKVTSIEKKLLRDQLPDYIWSTHNFFSRCPNCEKIYWRGSHHDRFIKWLKIVMISN